MSDKLVEEIKKQKQRIQRLRDENNTLRAVQRAYDKQGNLIDNLVGSIAKHIGKVKPNLVYPATCKEYIEWGDVVGISDWHIGEVVNSRELGNFNSFDYKIAQKRIDTYINKIIDTQRSKNLVVADLGDNIRGIIHSGLEDTEEGLMESLVKCVDYLVHFLAMMLNSYENIEYYFVVGNHSRLEDVIKSKGKYKDYSWLIIQMVMRLFKDEARITFKTSETGYNLVKVNTSQLLLFHGDNMRGYDPSNSGSRSKLQDICINLYNKKANHFFSGHTHIAVTVANQYGGKNIVSGTLVGSNEYGLQNGFSMIYPSQCKFFIDKTGNIEEILHFNL